jgi:hypothetical protein
MTKWYGPTDCGCCEEGPEPCCPGHHDWSVNITDLYEQPDLVREYIFLTASFDGECLGDSSYEITFLFWTGFGFSSTISATITISFTGGGAYFTISFLAPAFPTPIPTTYYSTISWTECILPDGVTFVVERSGNPDAGHAVVTAT